MRQGYLGPDAPAARLSIAAAALTVVRRPYEVFVRQWHWKAAMLSVLFRAVVFFAANLPAGRHAALRAMWTEILFRFVTGGFHSSLTQAFRKAEPAWLTAVVVSLLFPALTHGFELAAHWLSGTPNLRASMAASIALSGVSTTVNWIAMRHGVLVVGVEGRPLSDDLRRVAAFFLRRCQRLFNDLSRPCHRRPV